MLGYIFIFIAFWFYKDQTFEFMCCIIVTSYGGKMVEQEILDVNPSLLNLIVMFASSAWYQLGKVKNPISNKIEKDLKKAKATIDILIMLRDKIDGNLTKKEKEMLTSTIFDLQINYADEIAKFNDDIENKNETKNNK
jgi:hypothetical protein